MHHRHYHSPFKRGLLSFGLVAFVMFFGTLGMHFIEKLPPLDAFYFMSMIATAQGSSYTPLTPGGKIFVSLISFISVGAVVAALGFLFGPFFGKLWRVGVMKLEHEVEILTKYKKDKPHKP